MKDCPYTKDHQVGHCYCVILCMVGCVLSHVCGGLRTARWRWLLPSTMRYQGVKGVKIQLVSFDSKLLYPTSHVVNRNPTLRVDCVTCALYLNKAANRNKGHGEVG